MALTETHHTEVETVNSRSRTFMRVWEGLRADLTLGTNGWTGTGLPLRGDEYPYGTWTNKVTPHCTSIHIDPNSQVGTVRVIAYYSCPVVLGD